MLLVVQIFSGFIAFGGVLTLGSLALAGLDRTMRRLNDTGLTLLALVVVIGSLLIKK